MESVLDLDESFMSLLYFLFAGIVFYVLMENIAPQSFLTVKLSIAWIFGIGFCIVSGKTIVWISRYMMPHVTCGNFSGSILGVPHLEREGDIVYAIFNTGESLEPFHFRGKLATLVIPYAQIHKDGSKTIFCRKVKDNYISTVLVSLLPERFLPRIVRNHLIRHKDSYNLNRVYFGKYSEEFLDHNPKISDYEDRINALNHQFNLRNDLLEMRNDEVIEIKKFADEMSGGKKTVIQKIFGKKEEEQQ